MEIIEGFFRLIRWFKLLVNFLSVNRVIKKIIFEI